MSGAVSLVFCVHTTCGAHIHRLWRNNEIGLNYTPTERWFSPPDDSVLPALHQIASGNPSWVQICAKNVSKCQNVVGQKNVRVPSIPCPSQTDRVQFSLAPFRLPVASFGYMTGNTKVHLRTTRCTVRWLSDWVWWSDTHSVTP